MAPIDIRPPGYIPQGTFSGTIPGEKGIERRRRLAEVLAQQGTSTAPVQHWTQAAARVAQSLAGVLGNYQANQMEGQRQSALAEALRTGTADDLMKSMDPDLQRVGIYKAQQAQEAAQAERAAAQDAQRQSNWQAGFDQNAQFHESDDARADVAAERAAATAAKPQIRNVLNADGSQSLVSIDQDGNVTPLQLPGQGAQANPDAAIPVPAKGMTEGEQKSFRFYRRARNANNSLSPEEEEALTSGAQNTVEWTRGALEKIPYVGEGAAGAANAAHSDVYQRAKIKADRIIASLNYSDSGATINKDEYGKQWNALIPVFGNGPDAIAQKRKMRTDAISSLKATTGRGRPTLDREEQAYAEADATIAAAPPERKDEARQRVRERLKELGYDDPGAE